MRNIQGIELIAGSQEELLPGFSADFPYIATCAELDKYREPLIPWHWHQAVELFYMEQGCLEYTTPNGTQVFPAGSGGLVNSNVLHSTRVRNAGGRTIQLLHLFDPALLSGAHGSRMEQKYVRPFLSAPGIELIALHPDDPAQAEILLRIRQAFTLSDEAWGYEFALREALTKIWMALFALAQPEMNAGKDNSRSSDQLKRMMVYIQEHYSGHISVDELAQAAYVSRRSCFRLFQEQLHTTPVEYLKGYRLQKACQMLARGNETITEIAGRCGLGSSSYFGSVFRQEFGCTPQEYRRHWHDSDRNRHE